MVMFFREYFVKRIRKFESEGIKTGLGGKLGNKGGVVILINPNLESGQKKSGDRLKNI